jgi:hypothetical protein
MSVNRSVQAAQRRRTAPNDPPVSGRGPQPSINSAQIFANQSRPGQGPHIPTGRLAGQQQRQHEQQQQQQMYNKQQQPKDGLSGVNKMTVPQAITLITLRLGAIESKLLHMPEIGMNPDCELNLDTEVVHSILTRLEALEKQSSALNSNSNSLGNVSTPELNLLKQQFDTLKQAVIQTKGTSTSLVKENVALKTQIDNLRKELLETKELLSALQNLTMDNSQKILELSVNGYSVNGYENNNFTDLQDLDGLQCDDGQNFNGQNFNENELYEFNGDGVGLQDFEEQNEIIGNDLKQLIESELNAN